MTDATFQAFVAGLMAVAVIIALEVVDIDQKHRHLVVLLKDAAQKAVECAAVGEPRQPVSGREFGELCIQRRQLVLHAFSKGDVAKQAYDFDLVAIDLAGGQFEVNLHPSE